MDRRDKTIRSFGTTPGASAYVCECSYSGCASTIDLSREEYEAVRHDGIRFAIAINHEDPEQDRVVAEYAHYAVVEKWLGAARRFANDTNPRQFTLSSSGTSPETDDLSGGADRG